MQFWQKGQFAMSIRDQPDPKNAEKHWKTYARAAYALFLREIANCDEYTHSRWYQFATELQFTSNLRTDFGTDWHSDTLILAQNDDSRATYAPLLTPNCGENRNPRATWALVLGRFGLKFSHFSPKMAIHERPTHLCWPQISFKITIHEQPVHWFWHRLALKFSHFSPKYRFTSNLRTFTDPQISLKTAIHEHPAHWFWHRLALKFSTFSAKMRFTNKLCVNRVEG